MKFTDSMHYFLLVMVAVAGIALSILFGSSDAEAGQSKADVVAVSALVYFPAQYALNAPNQINEHIQAF